MKLRELADKIGAEALTGEIPNGLEVRRVYAGDRMSDLLNEAASDTLIVTSLAGPQILRLAELMDAPGICIVKGTMPDAKMLDEATQRGTVLLVSFDGMFETCGKLYACLNQKDRAT